MSCHFEFISPVLFLRQTLCPTPSRDCGFTLGSEIRPFIPTRVTGSYPNTEMNREICRAVTNRLSVIRPCAPLTLALMWAILVASRLCSVSSSSLVSLHALLARVQASRSSALGNKFECQQKQILVCTSCGIFWGPRRSAIYPSSAGSHTATPITSWRISHPTTILWPPTRLMTHICVCATCRPRIHHKLDRALEMWTAVHRTRPCLAYLLTMSVDSICQKVWPV